MRRTTTFAIGLLLYAVALPVHAATITVTNTNDRGPGSLRQALTAANDGDTINFAVTGTITLTSGGLPINKKITSPAIDAGDPSFAPPPDHDQRGACFLRVFGGRIDVGSVETQLRPRCVTPAPRPGP
jgi:hypothetical protein